MNDDLELLISVWDIIKTYVSKKDRSEIPDVLVKAFDEYCDLDGVEHNINMFDSELKSAITEYFALEEEDHDDDEW